MSAPPLPAHEAARLAALASYDILDTAREPAYDDFTAMAAAICGTPIALISLIDRDRQWFKSEIGLERHQTSRDQAFCAHVIVENQTMVVADATMDARFHDNPLVVGTPNIRFYAGAALVTSDGHGIGTLCVIDRVPRTLTGQQISALEALSRQLMTHLDLRRANIVLRETESAKQKFVAHVSHELRTPLTSIRGAVALVLDGDPSLDGDSRELLTAAHRSANRLLALVNDLLDLERVGSGDLSVEKRACELRAVLERAADTMKPIAAQAGVTIDFAPVTLPLYADLERLTQVVINLLANAVRFAPRGSTIRVGVEHDAGQLRITIDDQGPGVPLSFRQEIFEPFKQVKGSTAHNQGGTGLGLTISHAIVKQHGGNILVGDAPGGGARFTIELPLTS